MLHLLVWYLWRGLILQQDNEPKHLKALTQLLKTREDQGVLDCPLQSPDLNLIQHSWGHLKTEKDHQSLTRRSFVDTVRSCRDNMSQQVIQKPVEYMQLECTLSLKQKGDKPNTKTFWNSSSFQQDSPSAKFERWHMFHISIIFKQMSPWIICHHHQVCLDLEELVRSSNRKASASGLNSPILKLYIWAFILCPCIIVLDLVNLRGDITEMLPL